MSIRKFEPTETQSLGAHRMRRRHFISRYGPAMLSPATGSVRQARAQSAGRVYRLGHLSNTSRSEFLTREATLPELAKLGFTEGKNLVFDGKVGEPEAMPGLMRELLAAKVDAVIAVGQVAVVQAAAATSTVPIVSFGSDLVRLGLAQSHVRPGGNVTGVSILTSELEIKRLAMLRDAAPNLRRVAALVSVSQNTVGELGMRQTAAKLGLNLTEYPVANPTDYSGAFAAMRAAKADALLIAAAPELYRDAAKLAALAMESRLPTVCEWAEMAHQGCMIGYGPNRTELRKRLAAQVALILRGASAATVPIELPVRFELAINQKVARKLGLVIPPSVRAIADEIVE